MAPQGELGVPGLPQSVFVIGDLSEGGLSVNMLMALLLAFHVMFGVLCVCNPSDCRAVSLTSYARLSASLATVSPASSPSPSSLETASSTLPRMNDFPDDGRKVIASTETKESVFMQRLKCLNEEHLALFVQKTQVDEQTDELRRRAAYRLQAAPLQAH